MVDSNAKFKIMNDLMKKYQGKCYLCGEKVDREYGFKVKQHKKTATRDHIIPISKGGRKLHESNLALACFECNHLKGNMTLEEYKQQSING